MKKYLKEINAAGMLLIAIGVVISLIMGHQYGVWPSAVGLLLWLTVVVYKAFHWKEYAQENRQNIIIILVAIVILYLKIFSIL